MTPNPILFSALSDGTRLRILEVLSEFPQALPVVAITRATGKPARSVSYHLNELLANRLVKFHKSGKFHLYDLNTPAIAEMAIFLQKLLNGAPEDDEAQGHEAPPAENPDLW